MDSKAFYLKYRPQKISQLDSIEISQSLLRTVKSGKIPHALLFSGPRGIGKTSAARILAKAVNCLHPNTSWEPCNKCSNCQEITNGSALDLIEIDAASNRGIDDIRSLREKIKLSPAKCKYKVYIIDEVHMLTTEAFNALLKTLEEPPAHAIFILCTTAPEKLPETIISRCTRFNFQKASGEEMVNSLKRIVKGEKLQVEKGVLEEIGKRMDGSFRDAHKILEQLAMTGKKITLEETKKILGRSENLSPDKLLAILVRKDIKAALEEVSRVVADGADLTFYSRMILDQLRLSLLAKVGMQGVEEPSELKSLDLQQLKKLIFLFSRAAQEIKINPIPQLPLEMAIIEASEEVGSNPNSTVTQPPVKTSPVIPRSHGANFKQVESKWAEILAGIRPMNHSVEALLKAARPLDFDGEALTLEVFYKFHKERLETEKCRKIIEDVVGQTVGSPVRLKCVLGEKKVTVSQEIPVSEIEEPKSDIINVANEIFNGEGVN